MNQTVLKNFSIAISSGVLHIDNIGLFRTNAQKCPKKVRCADTGCYKSSNHTFLVGFMKRYNYCLLQTFFYLGNSDNKDCAKEDRVLTL